MMDLRQARRAALPARAMVVRNWTSAGKRLTWYRPGRGKYGFGDRGRDLYHSHQRDRLRIRWAPWRLAAKAQRLPSPPAQTPVWS